MELDKECVKELSAEEFSNELHRGNRQAKIHLLSEIHVVEPFISFTSHGHRHPAKYFYLGNFLPGGDYWVHQFAVLVS